MLEVEKHEQGRKTLVLTEPSPVGGSKDVDQLRMALTVEMLNAVKGTYLERDVKDILKRFSRAVSPSLAAKLETLPRKFFTVNYYGVKQYEGASRDRLNVIIRCLIEQQRVRVAYRSQLGDGELNEYEFDPYTLLTYKGGLYVIGYSFKREQTVYLALERIEKVEPVVENGKPYIFGYPEEYSPEKFTEGRVRHLHRREDRGRASDPQRADARVPQAPARAPHAEHRGARGRHRDPSHDGARHRGARDLGDEHGALGGGAEAGEPSRAGQGDAERGPRSLWVKFFTDTAVNR